VLVVDGVPLVVLHQAEEVGELHRDDAAGPEQDLHAPDEVVEVRYVGQHVVAQQQVGVRLGGERLGRLHAEELDERRDALLQRDLGHVGRRLDPEHGHAALVEVLQQVAVVGGELHDVAGVIQLEALDHLLDVAAAVVQPRGRVRREVGVVAEDVLRGLVLLELDEVA
jgi:hypothetical protein